MASVDAFGSKAQVKLPLHPLGRLQLERQMGEEADDECARKAILHLQPAHPLLREWRPSLPEVAAARYEVWVPQGKYRVSASVGEFACEVLLVDAEGERMLDPGALEVSAFQSSKLRVVEPTAGLHGTVRQSAEPRQPTWVFAVLEADSRVVYRSACSADGGFDLGHLPAGDYTVFGLQEGRQWEAYDVLESGDGRLLRVSLKRGEHVNVELEALQ